MSENGKTEPNVLLIGASKGLGHAMAVELVKRGAKVTGTVRGEGRTKLHDLADVRPDLVSIERLDVTKPAEISGLRERLDGQNFDILFHNAGTANRNQDESIAEVSTEEFANVMITNALSPMRVIETLQDLVPDDGLIGIMSSGQGSIADNEKGGHEVYRGTKAALNQYMRSYAARYAGEPRALLLMAPGWIKTRLGGPEARFTMDETVPDIVDVLLAKQGRPGLEFLDREGNTVRW
mgnify:CR=1 FL=1